MCLGWAGARTGLWRSPSEPVQTVLQLLTCRAHPHAGLLCADGPPSPDVFLKGLLHLRGARSNQTCQSRDAICSRPVCAAVTHGCLTSGAAHQTEQAGCPSRTKLVWDDQPLRVTWLSPGSSRICWAGSSTGALIDNLGLGCDCSRPAAAWEAAAGLCTPGPGLASASPTAAATLPVSWASVPDAAGCPEVGACSTCT